MNAPTATPRAVTPHDVTQDGVQHGAPGITRTVWAAAGPRRGRVLAGVALRFLQSAALGVPYVVVLWVLTRIRDGGLEASTVWTASALVLASLVAQLVFGFASITASWIASYLMVADMRLRLLDHIRSLPLGFHLARQQGDTVSAVTSDMRAVEDFASDGLPKVAQAIGLPVVVLGALTIVDPPMAAAAAVSVVVAVPVFVWSNSRFRELGIERQDLQAGAASRMIEYIQGIPVVRAFNAGGEHQRTFHTAMADFRDVSQRMVRRLVPPLLGFAAVVQLGAAAGFDAAG